MFWVILSIAHKFNQYHYFLEVLKSKKKPKALNKLLEM